MKKHFCYLLLGVLVTPIVAYAHPGRTDGSGCHTCRTNCSSWGLSSGEYHCHQSKGVIQPVAPIHSVKNVGGIGHTIPAPEYSIPKNNTQAKSVPFSKPNVTIPVVKKENVKSPWYIRMFNIIK